MAEADEERGGAPAESHPSRPRTVITIATCLVLAAVTFGFTASDPTRGLSRLQARPAARPRFYAPSSDSAPGDPRDGASASSTGKCPDCPDPSCPASECPACLECPDPSCPASKCPDRPDPSCPASECPACLECPDPSCPASKCPDRPDPSCPASECPACPDCPDPSCPASECPACAECPAPPAGDAAQPASACAPPQPPREEVDLALGADGRSRPCLRHVARSEEPLRPAVEEVYAGLALPRDVLDRAVLAGSNPRLRTLIRKLRAGRPVKVVLIGGSISQHAGCFGRGCKEHIDQHPGIAQLQGNCALDAEWACNKAFAYKLMAWINATWPHPGHMLLNGARGGQSAQYVCDCFRNVVPEDVDLAVVEFNVNEDVVMNLETAARRILLLRTRPALVFLHTYLWSRKAGGEPDREERRAMVEASEQGRLRANETVARRLQRTGFHDDPSALATAALAMHYGASSVSAYAALAPELIAEAPGIHPVHGFTQDGIHPRGSPWPGAHKEGAYGGWLFLLLKHALLREALRPAFAHAHAEEAADAAALAAELPRPLFDTSPVHSLACYGWTARARRPLVRSNTSAAGPAGPLVSWTGGASAGAAEGSAEERAVEAAAAEARAAALGYPRGVWWVHDHANKPGLVVSAGAEGALVELEVDASVPEEVRQLEGGNSTAHLAYSYSEAKLLQDAQWVQLIRVSHLISWRDNMGAARMSCVSGCECEDFNTGAKETYLEGRRLQYRISANSEHTVKILPGTGTSKCILRFEAIASTRKVYTDWYRDHKEEDPEKLTQILRSDLEAMSVSFRIVDINVIMEALEPDFQFPPGQ